MVSKKIWMNIITIKQTEMEKLFPMEGIFEKVEQNGFHQPEN